MPLKNQACNTRNVCQSAFQCSEGGARGVGDEIWQVFDLKSLHRFNVLIKCIKSFKVLMNLVCVS